MIYRIVDANDQGPYPAAIYHSIENAQQMAAQYNNPSFVMANHVRPFRVQEAEMVWREVTG